MNIADVTQLEDWMNTFIVMIHGILDKCFKKEIIIYKPTFTWFTSEIRQERDRVSALYKRYKNNLHNHDYRDAYIKQTNVYKKLVREAKKKAWYVYCEKTSETFGNLYKFIKGKSLKFSDLIFCHSHLMMKLQIC